MLLNSLLKFDVLKIIKIISGWLVDPHTLPPHKNWHSAEQFGHPWSIKCIWQNTSNKKTKSERIVTWKIFCSNF